MTKFLMKIGEIIKKRRKSTGLTQAELAEKSNLTQAKISQIESGASDNVTIGNLRNLAKALGCTLIDLLPEQDTGKKS
jgi:transcriptional regulator with XRE-family HTH domain